MAFLGLISWWYTTGWLTLIRKSASRVEAVLKFFSVPLLLTSLFAPFRQISAGRVRGSLSVQLQAWGDRLFSRVIGALVRSFLIILGLLIMGGMGLLSLLIIAAWPFIPFAPLVGLLFMGAQ